MSDVPIFAVVGRVNKGKSSVVATLTEDDTVEIAPRPGVTKTAEPYKVTVDGVHLLSIVDTPGFEEAPRALAWLRARVSDASSRAVTVEAFLEAHENTDDFEEECKLLRPIVDGASILYVVDAAQKYRPNFEAEMEILRWTGRAGMALLNNKGGNDESDEWRRALDQYFKVVRTFDAHMVGFHERIRLLETFRELRDDWFAPLKSAIDALKLQRLARIGSATSIIAELLLDCVTYTLDVGLEEEDDWHSYRKELEERFHTDLREKEIAARCSIEELFAHNRRWTESKLPQWELSQDLFAEQTWSSLGLTTKQLLPAYTATGAVAGLGIDAAVGGVAGPGGTLVGAGFGLATGLFQARQRFIRAATPGGLWKRLKGANSGRCLRIGPHDNLQFPWVLLDRALIHLSSVATRAHARQDEPTMSATEDHSLVRGLDAAERRSLNMILQKLRKRNRDVPRKLRDNLHRQVADLQESVLGSTLDIAQLGLG